MKSWQRRSIRISVALLPILAFAIGTPLLVNSVTPRILGLPLNLSWVVLWLLLTPLCLVIVERLRVKSP